MTGQMQIDTDQVLQVANKIENLNGQLLDQLNTSKSTIQGLTNTWQGQASNQTVDAYNSFAGRYFNQYHDLLQNYVTFLRGNVSSGYAQTEQVNTNWADQFK